MALRDFVAVIQKSDVARSNRFVVEIQPPTIPGLGIKPQEQINLMCQDVQFPGQNIRTSTDDLRQGPTREIAQAVTYGSTNMTFICTPGLPEKLFFEAWQKLMFNHITWQAKYYNSYIGQIKLRQLDRTDLVRYGIILYEAYPKIIMAQDYSNTSSDAIQTLQVEFAFHHWAMDEDLYRNPNLDAFGSHERGHIPKRKKLAGTENMTDAEMLAWLRGEILNELGQTYEESMLAATGGKSIAGGLAETLTAKPAKEALAQATVDDGGKYSTKLKLVPADAHPKADSSSSSQLSSLKATIGNLMAFAPKAKPILNVAMDYLIAVEQDAKTGAVKELAAKASDSPTKKAFVDPNTGKTVPNSAGSTSTLRSCWGAAPASSTDSPAVASTMDGLMTSAKGLSHSTGSLDAIAGVRSQAVTNLGGGISSLVSGIAANVSSARGASALSASLPGFSVKIEGAGFSALSISTLMSNASSLGGKASFGGAQGGQKADR